MTAKVSTFLALHTSLIGLAAKPKFDPLKACSYCGRKNEPDALACFECGTGFPVSPTEEGSTNDQFPSNAEVATAKPEAGFQIAPPIPDLLELDRGFEFVEGFSRPNWKTVNEYIRQRVSPQEFSAAWEFAAQKWLEQLAKGLGGGGCLHSSPHFLCVSDLDRATTRTLLAYAESVLTAICTSLIVLLSAPSNFQFSICNPSHCSVR